MYYFHPWKWPTRTLLTFKHVHFYHNNWLDDFLDDKLGDDDDFDPEKELSLAYQKINSDLGTHSNFAT